MKKVIDTQETDDPNEFGEIIREFAFVDEFGCYSCFELKEEFKPVTSGFDIEGRLFMAMRIHPSQDDPEWPSDECRSQAKCYSNGSIHIGWYWDGDGTLAIIEGDKAAVNTDCKKMHRWVWCDS